MQYMLARVVSEVDGTGKKASVKGYNVAGKTGTAQQVKPSERGGDITKKGITHHLLDLYQLKTLNYALL